MDPLSGRLFEVEQPKTVNEADILKAADTGDLEQLGEITQQCKELNLKNITEALTEALFVAISKENEILAEEVLKLGANSNGFNKKGCTPLTALFTRQCPEVSIKMVKVLLNWKADPNLKDKNKQLPFVRAATKACKIHSIPATVSHEIINILIDANADIDACENVNNALGYVLQFQEISEKIPLHNKSLLWLLVKREAKVSVPIYPAKDPDNIFCAIFQASNPWRNSKEVFKFLMERGSDFNPFETRVRFVEMASRLGNYFDLDDVKCFDKFVKETAKAREFYQKARLSAADLLKCDEIIRASLKPFLLQDIINVIFEYRKEYPGIPDEAVYIPEPWIGQRMRNFFTIKLRKKAI